MVLKMLPTIRSILKITVQSILTISALSFSTATSSTSLLCSVWITAIICAVTGRHWNMMKPVQISWITSAEMTVRISSSMAIMPIHPMIHPENCALHLLHNCCNLKTMKQIKPFICCWKMRFVNMSYVPSIIRI